MSNRIKRLVFHVYCPNNNMTKTSVHTCIFQTCTYSYKGCSEFRFGFQKDSYSGLFWTLEFRIRVVRKLKSKSDSEHHCIPSINESIIMMVNFQIVASNTPNTSSALQPYMPASSFPFCSQQISILCFTSDLKTNYILMKRFFSNC